MKFVSEVQQCQATKGEGICKPERPAWNLFAMELTASLIGVVVADSLIQRCGRDVHII